MFSPVDKFLSSVNYIVPHWLPELWRSFRAKVKHRKHSLKWCLPKLCLETQRGRPETIWLKSGWQADKWFCWKVDHQTHILNHPSTLGGDGGQTTMPMNIWEVRMCVKVCVAQAGGTDFWDESFSRRVRAFNAARRTFFLLEKRKAFILRHSQEALENPQPGRSYLLGGFSEKAAWFRTSAT